jgi:hypothetical protein
MRPIREVGLAYSLSLGLGITNSHPFAGLGTITFLTCPRCSMGLPFPHERGSAK